MIEHGHSWPAVQSYTLSEIGEFLVTVVGRKASRASEQLSLMWMGSNITHEGLLKVTEGFEKQSTKAVNKLASQGRVKTDIRRLMGASQTY